MVAEGEIARGRARRRYRQEVGKFLCPCRLRGGGGQQRGEQQDECRSRGAEKMNGSVPCLISFYVYINFTSDILFIFAPVNPNMLGL